MTAAITCSDLSFSWPDGTSVLSGLTLSIGGGRTGLIGANGSGKSTLLKLIAGELRPGSGTVRATGDIGYLPQAVTLRAGAPAALINEVRASLARFGFRGERAAQRAGTLSGGERFRAVLAVLLLAQPAPQLLLLDEPTNHLDLASVRQLTQALQGYRGAMIVASHDVPFLGSAGITRWLRLDRDAGLSVIAPS